MNLATHNTIIGFIWNIADDVLRDVYVRGKYRDVILPMTVIRRLDCLLEPTKEEVIERHKFLEEKKIHSQAPQLERASGYKFYNTSRFTLRRLLDETAEPVIFEQTEDATIYEPDSELRDTEEVPLKEEIAAYFEREVLPYVPHAWVDYERTVRGYEILFTKYFYKFKPLRSLEEIKEDILKLEAMTEGVLRQIVEDV